MRYPVAVILSVGDKVRIARDAMTPPWSQHDLATIAGVARERIKNWELSRSKRPNPEDIRRVAEAMNIPVEWFYDGKPGPPPEAGNARIVDDPRIVAGFAVTAAVRAYEGAAAGFDHDEPVFELVGMVEIPTAFLVGGTSKIDAHDVVRVSGRSLEPRVQSGDGVLIHRNPTLYKGAIVLATNPEGKVYLKVLRQGGDGWELHSLSKHGSAFTDLAGWQIHGYAVAILRDEDEPGPNVEWRGGRPLKA